MKCICGYYHYEDYQINMMDDAFKEETIRNNGSEEFHKVLGSFHISDDYSYTRSEKPISIYMCPKCGTLKAVD